MVLVRAFVLLIVVGLTCQNVFLHFSKQTLQRKYENLRKNLAMKVTSSSHEQNRRVDEQQLFNGSNVGTEWDVITEVDNKLGIVPWPTIAKIKKKNLLSPCNVLKKPSAITLTITGETALQNQKYLFSGVTDAAREVFNIVATGTNYNISVCVRVKDNGVNTPNEHVNEQYELEWLPSFHDKRCNLHIRAATIVGAIWGLRTAAQLFAWPLSGAVCGIWIKDIPRYGHRGVMLDPARHFIPVSILKTVINAMALVKLNVLHLHLSDDQGFAFASNKLPCFQSAGTTGGQYTVNDMKAIVEFATYRGVRIIPEIDVPGHAASWRHCNPTFISKCPVYVKRNSEWGIPLNFTNEQALNAVEILIEEMYDIFPDKRIHLGGDEVAHRCWEEHEHLDAFLAKYKLKNSKAVGGKLMQRFMAKAQSLGKSVIVWQEVFDDFVFRPRDDVIPQVWISKFAFTDHLKKGYHALLSWGWYLNENAETSCRQWADCLAIEPTKDPTNYKKLSNHDKLRIDGGECALWETKFSDVKRLLWPRAAAVSERLWSTESTYSPNNFKTRLSILMNTMTKAGWTNSSI